MERHVYRINGQGYVVADSAEAACIAWREYVGGASYVTSIERIKLSTVIVMPCPGGPIKHTCVEWITLLKPGYMCAEGYA